MPGPGNFVTTSAPFAPQNVQVAPVVSMWLILRTLSGPTLVSQPYWHLIRRTAHWYRPKTCRPVWVWYTLLPPLQSKLRLSWAPNSWAPESRTTLRRHMLPEACCTASSKRYLRYYMAGLLRLRPNQAGERMSSEGWVERSFPPACRANAVRTHRVGFRLTSDEIRGPTSRNLNHGRGRKGGHGAPL